MRLDKYLKLSRIMKRRKTAKDLVQLGRVEINGRLAKPSSEVKKGDILFLQLKNCHLTIRVSCLGENIKNNEAESIYTVLKEERKDIKKSNDML
ncbi:MAG: S4 domain-containing protein [Bacilli bacterium]|jgi:ribosomal 50S subunit-recycling heat shock protein